MIQSLIYIIVAVVALEIFSDIEPVGMFGYPLVSLIGTAGFMLLTGLLGYIRVRSLIAKVRKAFPDDPHKRMEILSRWKSSFQLTITVTYIGVLWICGWGYFTSVHLGLSGSILLDEVVGLCPYILLLGVSWTLSYLVQNRAGSEQWSYRGWIIFNMQITFVPAVPLLLFITVFDLLYYLPYPLCLWFGSGGSPGDFLVILVILSGAGVVFPYFLVKMWSCSPLEDGPQRHLIESVCRAHGLLYRDIMVWDIGEGKFLNAGIMGVTRHFRYVLFTRKILNVLSDDELTAVLGHEIGHSKSRHILLNIIISFGFLSFFIVVSSVLGSLGIFFFPGVAELILFGVTVGTVVLYWRVIFGYISRRFERQADLYGVKVAGSADPMISALEKLAQASGRSKNHPNWTHYTIAERIGFLEDVKQKPYQGEQFIRRTEAFVKKLVTAAVVLFIVSMGIMTRSAEERPMIDKWFRDGRYKVLEQYFYDKLGEDANTDLQRASHFNNLAWMYATSKDEGYFKPYKALYYAGRAVSIVRAQFSAGQQPTAAFRETAASYIDTLAASYFGTGDNITAVYYSEIAVTMCPRKSSVYVELVKNLIKFRKAMRRNEMPI